MTEEDMLTLLDGVTTAAEATARLTAAGLLPMEVERRDVFVSNTVQDGLRTQTWQQQSRLTTTWRDDQ